MEHPLSRSTTTTIFPAGIPTSANAAAAARASRPSVAFGASLSPPPPELNLAGCLRGC